MNTLVTGGAGYIGSVTVETLIARGHRVVVVDDLRKGHRAAVHPDADFVRADLHDAPRLEGVMREHAVEAVVHFAASSLVGESMERPLHYFDNNVAATLSLLTAMEACSVERFIFSSTAALFGTPDRVPIPEDAAIRPESVYGESKLLIERMLRWLCERRGLGFAALRYFNAAGASERFGEDHHPETHLIPLILQVAQGKRAKILVYGDDYATPDGTPVRDYIHVVDLAEAHLLALEALAPGEARRYNLGNGAGFSVLEVIEACRLVSGHPIPAQMVERRAGDPPTLVADATRIRDELGWRPTTPDLETMVASAWRWHLAHPDGYPSP
jgi:UDP-glucose 4-epimerase